MKQVFTELVRGTLKKFNIGIVKYSTIQKYREYEKDIASINKISEKETLELATLITKSKSQLKQDLFVLSQVDFKRNGFFVEFGATNGVDLSNSYLLEKEFEWDGILAEPARCWHKKLRSNRDCNIETKCVWTDSNSVLNFNQLDNAELSTISTYNDADQHTRSKEKGQNYIVDTISLTDLLDKYNAPQTVDYLSIDTEGSEYEILNSFDFDQYKFNVITCEHNYTANRKKIFKLLSKHGYIRKYPKLSKFDDWYVRPE